MSEKTNKTVARSGLGLRAVSIGCLGVFALVLGVLVIAFGYFGPGLPAKDYMLVHRQHVLTQSEIDPRQAARSAQLVEEITLILEEAIKPILNQGDLELAGDEAIDPNLPTEQVSAIREAMEAVETSGLNARLDELLAIGAVIDSSDSMSRRLTRLYSGQLTLAWRSGDAPAAALAYARLRGLANARAQSAMSLLGRLVANAVDMHGMSTLRILLTERTADKAMLEAIWDVHRGMPGRKAWPDLAAVLEGERIIARDSIKREGVNLPIRAINPGAADQDFGRLNQHALDTWALTGQDRIRTLRNDADSWYDGMTPIAQKLVPSYTGFLASEISCLAIERATSIAIAIELHRARLGSLPTVLSDLSTEYFATVPTDPCIEGPFGYVLDGSSSLGYRLYTVGFDGVDNQGVVNDDPYHGMHLLAEDNDEVFMPASRDD